MRDLEGRVAQATAALSGRQDKDKDAELELLRLQDENKYTFRVALTANKTLVKQAVETLFDVKVRKVTMVRLPGKVKRFGPRLTKGPDKKKAIVTLREGDRITVFEGV